MMKTLTLASAAAALALGLAATAQAAPSLRLSGVPSLVQKAGCYDECEEYMEAVEEAREEAYEAAAEAAEEAAEYGYNPRRSRRQARAQERESEQPHMVEKPTADKNAGKSAKEEPAAVAPAKKAVAVNTQTNCKQYSPATGMLLSVPCE
jgi:hypothetical protein